MPFVTRTATPLTPAEMLSVPQIILEDLTGPAVPVGVSGGIALLVGEFIKGSFVPTEVTSGGELASLYGAQVYRYFSQNASGVQDGSQVSWNGNGLLQLQKKTFKRLGILRVDAEAVTTDGGTTRSALTITLTIAAADQEAGVTNKDIVVPAGRRFADQAIGTATQIVGLSGDIVIPKGTTVTANQVVVTGNCIVIKEPEPVVAIAASAIDTVIDAEVPGAAAGTVISLVTNAAAVWPPGTGTTLSARIETRYLAAIPLSMPSGSVATDQVTAIWAARRSTAIRQALVENVRVASAGNAIARVAFVSADPATAPTAAAASAAKTAAVALAQTESYGQPEPADRTFICFPHVKITVPDLGNIAVVVSPDSFGAVTRNQFPAYYNMGQANPYVQGIDSLEDAFVVGSPLVKQDYVNLQAGGVMALQKDPRVGWWFMNGVTAANPALHPTRAPGKRRTMADEIQASLALIGSPYLKQPATEPIVQAFIGEVNAYLRLLLSPEDPTLQQIAEYFVDAESGNQSALTRIGIYTVLVFVRLLPTMDVIRYKTMIGETVEVPVQVAA